MKFRLIPVLMAVACLLALGFTACQKETLPNVATPEVTTTDSPIVSDRSSNTVVDIALSNPDFSALVAAVVKTGQVGFFSNVNLNGTVFAPTNAAFAQLPAPLNTAENINGITDAATINTLRQVLRFHAISGQRTAALLSNGNYQTFSNAATPGSNLITVGRSVANEVFVNGNTKVVAADIQASNGVIHVIDRVLLPPSQDIVQIAATNGNFTALVAALKKAGLASQMSQPGSVTVFAPTDAAFAQLPAPLNNAANISSITDPATISLLRNVLRYHVVPARVFSVDIRDALSVPTALAGSNLTTTLTGGAKIKGTGNGTASNIVAVNLLARNGVIHVIDQVLLP